MVLCFPIESSFPYLGNIMGVISLYIYYSSALVSPTVQKNDLPYNLHNLTMVAELLDIVPKKER